MPIHKHHITTLFKESFKQFLELLFPTLCVCCRNTSVIRDQYVCAKCASEIPFTDHFTNQENKVIERFYGRLPIADGAALFYFSKGSLVQNMLYEFKYKGERIIGLRLGKLLGHKILDSSYFKNVDVIIPIPIHYKKRLRRGFNQTEIISQGLSTIIGLPTYNNVLVKLFDTESQTNKGREERQINVANTLGIQNKSLIIGKNILLVDDIITTGATAEAAGVTLLNNGASSISIVTVGAAV